MGRKNVIFLCSLIAMGGVIMVEIAASVALNYDYGDALSKSILFFEGQRSGKLPSTQRMTWRKDSALQDGSDVKMDLTGGYYDAGDNVKFNFPMAFTTTMLSWSVIEFGQFMGSDLQNALDAIRWGTDYLLKATSVPNVVVALVGDPNADHDCWERPEDMDTPRTSYSVSSQKPGSEVSAEIAAALAASSIVFKDFDPTYTGTLLNRAAQVFSFADTYQGSYNLSVGFVACPFYCDVSGYMDELVWAASWLYKATNKQDYWNYVLENIKTIEVPVMLRNSIDSSNGFYDFGWDTKHAGINVLVSQWVMNNASATSPFVPSADQFVCSILPQSPTKIVFYSPGGLLFKPGGSNLQHATALSFLLLTYGNYLQTAKKVVNCGNVTATPDDLIHAAKTQVDYILGNNPLGMAYMVGFGQKFPQRIHHRGSTLPSVDSHPQHIECHEGTPYFETSSPNQNLLTGAVTGGPAQDDSYKDSRYDVAQSEPTTYINAPLTGLLAYFKANSQ